MKQNRFRLLPEKVRIKLRLFWDALYELFCPHDKPGQSSEFGTDAVLDEGAFLCAEPEQLPIVPAWEERNVMVGSLRTPEQLRYTLDQKRYYTPDRFLPAGADHVKLIALHEEGIGTPPGIRIYGEVLSVHSLARKRIPVTMRPGSDPGELYREYTVKEWMPLPHPIHLLDTYRGRPQFTTEFLLKHCTRSYQLFVLSSREDLDLMRLLDQIFDAARSDTGVFYHAEYPFHSVTFHITDRMLNATDGEGYLPDTIPMDWLARHPRAGFCWIKRMLARQTEDRAEPE